MLRQKGRLDEALGAYQEAAERAELTGDWELARLSDAGWYLGTSAGPAVREAGRGLRVAETLFKALGNDVEVAFQHAGWLLYTGDRRGYRRLCARSLARHGKTGDPRTAYLLARMCSLDAEPAADLDRLAALARQAVAAAPGHCHYHTLALVDYRAGRFDQAVLHFRRARPWTAEVLNWLGLAAALHRSGKGGEARGWLEKARQALARQPLDLDSPLHPHDRIAGRLLLREVNRLVGE
jgi:hypothetical protein